MLDNQVSTLDENSSKKEIAQSLVRALQYAGLLDEAERCWYPENELEDWFAGEYTTYAGNDLPYFDKNFLLLLHDLVSRVIKTDWDYDLRSPEG